MTVDYDKHIHVPHEILQYCDSFTLDTERNDLRYIDCVYMNMGEYGNDPEELKKMRQRIMPVFD